MFIDYYYYLAFFLFFLGFAGCFFKKNLISVFICIELMLAATNLLFVIYGHEYKILDGDIFVLFSIVLAAAEAAIGFCLIIRLFRKYGVIEKSTLDEVEL